MKKTFIILALVLAVFATGCKKNEKSKALSFNGKNPFTMALRDTTALPVDSEYDVSVTSANNNVVKPYSGSTVIAKNVGQTVITISNGYETVNVDVEVDLFIEPTFEFGCNPGYITSLYGSPYAIKTEDDAMRYIYTGKYGYSWACGQMDFLFDEEDKYIEAQVYIREGLDLLLGNYINSNFNPLDTITIYNPIMEDSVACYRYRNKEDQSIIMGKYYSGDQWNETFLFYGKVSD